MLNEAKNDVKISAESANKMLSVLPENMPFYRVQSANTGSVVKSISNTIFDREVKTVVESENYSHHYDNYNFDDNDNWHNYSSLDGKYDKTIDDVEDTAKVDTKMNDDFNQKLAQILQSVNPNIILTAARPQMLEKPLFAEFNRVTVLKLNSPENLNRTILENVIAEELKRRLMISASDTVLSWETKSENGQTWRELNPSSLGWGIAYTIRDDQLILSNNPIFLREILTVQNKQTKTETAFNNLTVINFDQRQAAFDDVMKPIEEANKTNFFTGNISSLLDTVSEVRRVEIKQNYTENFLHEEVSLILSE